MTGVGAAPLQAGRSWRWPLDLSRYDRHGMLRPAELAALRALGWELRRPHRHAPSRPQWRTLRRLVRPLDDAYAALGWRPGDEGDQRAARDAIAVVLRRCEQLQTAYWSWAVYEWTGLIAPGSREFRASWPRFIDGSVRQYVIAYAYLLGEVTDLHAIGAFQRLPLAWRIFGKEPVDAAVDRVFQVLREWGYQRTKPAQVAVALTEALLRNRSPLLADLTTEALVRIRDEPGLGPQARRNLYGVHRVIAALGHADPPVPPRRGVAVAEIEGVAASWGAWIERWHATSTLVSKSRNAMRSVMAKVGRWLAAEHPRITEPSQWTRETCTAWIVAVDRMHAGDYAQRRRGPHSRSGPLTPNTKYRYLTAVRVFFGDLQEWDWIPRRFNPWRALATPRNLKALLGPNPRVIADDVWAKLMWAGLNVQPDDFRSWYPIELLRAVTITWMFSGLRSDEIARLCLGCIRWQHDDQPTTGDSDTVLARDAVCLLDVPTHKTGTAFTKPVDPLVGQAIEAWQRVRPTQPSTVDRKTGQRVDLLFSIRAKAMCKDYINGKVIPTLCGKAGVPTSDVRGSITSHRARTTIASQLYNAKEPMTLYELQEWLGHRSPETTQHYTKISPKVLARAYTDAGYFARNVRTIEVLIDRDAVQHRPGEPWQYYDLGHGWCTYTFFEQCPHRMACARCDFYLPKQSTKAQLLEAKDNLQRMLAAVPLTDDERAAVDDGQTALDNLLSRLADTPTPDGHTPRQIGIPATATRLPVVAVRQGDGSCGTPPRSPEVGRTR